MRYRSPVTTIISVVAVVGGGWLSLEVIGQAGASGRAVHREDGARFVGSASMEEAIDPTALKDLHCYACRGATVIGASGVAAREVLRADEANLLPNVLSRRPGKEPDDPLRCQSGWGVRVDLRVA
jgi:hypothetical protein